MPDFVLPATEALLRIDEGEFAGVRVWIAARRTVGDILRWSLTDAEDSDDPRQKLLAVGSKFRIFGDQYLRRWNLVAPVINDDGERALDDAGNPLQEPVPPTTESLLSLPDTLAMELLRLFDIWIAEVAGVPNPLSTGSLSGPQSEAQSETTGRSSPSRRNSSRRKSSKQ